MPAPRYVQGPYPSHTININHTCINHTVHARNMQPTAHNPEGKGQIGGGVGLGRQLATAINLAHTTPMVTWSYSASITTTGNGDPRHNMGYALDSSSLWPPQP